MTPTVIAAATANAGDIVLRLDPDAGLGTEGYQLTVDTTVTVTVSAPTSTGAYYGGRSSPICCGWAARYRVGSARDWPSLAYRAESFDVSRRFMTVAEVSDEIRRISWNKLNVLQLMFNQANAFRLYDPAYAAAAPTSPATATARATSRPSSRWQPRTT